MLAWIGTNASGQMVWECPPVLSQESIDTMCRYVDSIENPRRDFEIILVPRHSEW